MTSQMIDQSLPPGPLAGTAAPDAPGARQCKQPGCGSELPAAAGRGAPRLFCSPACSRKWHNDHRPAAEQATAAPGPAAGPLTALHQLLTDAASLVAGAAAELATADPGRVTAALAAADAARRQAQAETAVALARAAQAAQDAEAAAAAVREARHDTLAALEAAGTARADAEAADARAQASRDEADVQIAGIRREASTLVTSNRDEASAALAGRDAALQRLKGRGPDVTAVPVPGRVRSGRGIPG